MNNITYSLASENDLPLIQALLIENQLPYLDVGHHLDHFILAKESGNVIGCVGLEICGEYALLRSLAVSLAFRSEGIAGNLLSSMEVYAIQHNVSYLYLLTITAENYFSRRNFFKIEKAEAPESIRHTKEFLGLCPASAICMYKKIQTLNAS